MTDLAENTTKQDEAEEEQYHDVMGWLPDWAKEALKQAMSALHLHSVGAATEIEKDLANNVVALCSALAAALRQVQMERGTSAGFLRMAMETYNSMVEQAVRDERERAAIIVENYSPAIDSLGSGPAGKNLASKICAEINPGTEECATMVLRPVELEFPGFESLHDFQEDMCYALQEWSGLDPEYEGTIKVTMEYIP